MSHLLLVKKDGVITIASQLHIRFRPTTFTRCNFHSKPICESA